VTAKHPLPSMADFLIDKPGASFSLIIYFGMLTCQRCQRFVGQPISGMHYSK
jgi:hypothetical protein